MLANVHSRQPREYHVVNLCMRRAVGAGRASVFRAFTAAGGCAAACSTHRYLPRLWQ